MVVCFESALLNIPALACDRHLQFKRFVTVEFLFQQAFCGVVDIFVHWTSGAFVVKEAMAIFLTQTWTKTLMATGTFIVIRTTVLRSHTADMEQFRYANVGIRVLYITLIDCMNAIVCFHFACLILYCTKVQPRFVNIWQFKLHWNSIWCTSSEICSIFALKNARLLTHKNTSYSHFAGGAQKSGNF